MGPHSVHSHLNGYINKLNCKFCDIENPKELHQHQLHPHNALFGTVLWLKELSAPISLKMRKVGQKESTRLCIGQRLNIVLRPAVEDNQEVWFKQDGATAHTARVTMDLLRKIFGEQIISTNAEFVCPRHSPDLSVPDIFLWGYVKERVYINKPRTIQELKENIRAEIRRLGPETLRTVMENAVERACICEQENGSHLRDVVFHT